MVVLGLGTNQGDRAAHLRTAVSHCRVLLSGCVCSPVYESPALLPEGAPQAWDVPFLNMAVAGDTALAPHALLEAVKAIEAKMGRTARGHWGPREIDIDILTYDALTISDPVLTLPHQELLRRDFALVPFADVAPDWVHPLKQKTARALADDLPQALTRMTLVIP